MRANPVASQANLVGVRADERPGVGADLLRHQQLRSRPPRRWFLAFAGLAAARPASTAAPQAPVARRR